MTRKNNNKIIAVAHPICCGLDRNVYSAWPRSVKVTRKTSVGAAFDSAELVAGSRELKRSRLKAAPTIYNTLVLSR